jgi:hypothetical protein
MNANKNTSGKGGAKSGQAGERRSEKKNVALCGVEHITQLCAELAKAGLALKNTDGDTQISTLEKVLQYLGSRGLSTYEGTAAGYLRLATRVKELKQRWNIYTLREDVIGPDGLFHKRVARYVLIGRRIEASNGSADHG